MADKFSDKKLSKFNLVPDDSTKQEKMETPIDYLYRSGVSAQVKEVLNLIISNRPEDPVVFLSEYFNTQQDSISAISKAQRKLLLAHHSKSVFWENMMDSYQDLCKEKALNGIRGLIGKAYNELLLSLCSDMNTAECDTLMKRLMCRDNEVIPFSIYRQGVLTCIIFQDFLKQAENLYCELDLSERGLADKGLCQVSLNHLKTVVILAKLADPMKILELGTRLSTTNLNSTMYEALVSGPQTKRETMSLEEFMAETIGVFLEQLPAIR